MKIIIPGPIMELGKADLEREADGDSEASIMCPKLFEFFHTTQLQMLM